MTRAAMIGLFLSACLAACDGTVERDGGLADAGRRDAGSTERDGGEGIDAGAGLDAGPPIDAAGDDAGVDAGASSPDAGAPGPEVLLNEAGCFTPSASERFRRFAVGVDGTVYDRVVVRLDVVVGPWRPHVPDPSNRTEHLLFGFSRANRPRSFERYLFGAAAVDFVSRAPHFRMFGREDIAMGFMSYTQVSATYRWSQGTRYRVACALDAVRSTQVCELSTGGAVVATRSLDVAYLDAAAHLSSAFELELGTDQPLDHDHLQSPIGWQLCDVVVEATPR